MGSSNAKQPGTVYPEATPHLNRHGLLIRSSPHTGRGVYTSRDLERGTLVEISPVLLFPREEYLAHGRHTALDSYTFVWRDKTHGGEKIWALALGLGQSCTSCSWVCSASIGVMRPSDLALCPCVIVLSGSVVDLCLLIF